MELTERLIIISTGAIVLLMTLFVLTQAFLNSRNVKAMTEILIERSSNIPFQDRTEAAFKEMGLANERLANGWYQLVGIAVSGALLANKEDAAEFFKHLQSIGVKVLDGQPNTPPVTEGAGVG